MMESGFGFGIPELSLVITWGLIISLVIWLVRGISGESRNKGAKGVLEILDDRFACGEISREEYEEKKKALT